MTNTREIPAVLLLCIFLRTVHASSIQGADAPPTPPSSERPGRVDLAIDTDNPVGTCYRFWTVKVVTGQSRFGEKKFVAGLKADLPYTTSINCVRLLGGRADHENEWYQGTNADGSLKVDFGPLVLQLKGMLENGFTPRLVLDNVPQAMCKNPEMNDYGNTAPPDDFSLWHQYITAFVRTLVKEFGMETVRSWRFRVGTEPDLFPGHWTGTREQYFKHYDVTVDAVTKIIPEADIGPGNILNPAKQAPVKGDAAALVGKGKGWGVSLIDHLGKTGTRTTFFSISYYGHVNQPTILEESIRRVRERLDTYPALKKIPFDIQEFAVLSDENKKRLWGGDSTEWAASWYAAIADIAYRSGVNEIYEWGYSTQGVPHPRQQVIGMLDKMAGGQRLSVNATGTANGQAGAIACSKEGRVYLLLYNHHPQRTPEVRNTLALKIQGAAIAKPQTWTMNEWTVDHDHGVWTYQMYRDFEKAGLKPIPGSALFDGLPQKCFGDAWRPLFESNRAKYEQLAKLSQTASGTKVTPKNGVISMDFDMPGHSVKLVELTPTEER
jgi:xylan 1,4-beta-xylosidase